MSTLVRNGVTIETEHVYPPIPDRRFDWSAIVPDEYDGAPDSNCPIGRGPTEEAAIADLLEQLAAHDDDDDMPADGRVGVIESGCGG